MRRGTGKIFMLERSHFIVCENTIAVMILSQVLVVYNFFSITAYR